MIDEVIGNLRDAFADEGIDEAVLGDLKNLWKKKLEDSRALEGPVQDHQPVRRLVTGFDIRGSHSFNCSIAGIIIKFLNKVID